jgi:hypothetical protein
MQKYLHENCEGLRRASAACQRQAAEAMFHCQVKENLISNRKAFLHVQSYHRPQQTLIYDMIRLTLWKIASR